MLIFSIKKIIYFFYKKLYFLNRSVKFEFSSTIDLYSKFEGSNKLYAGVRFINSFLGYGSYVATESVIVNTHIGRFCSIGPRVRTVLGRHPVQRFISTHPAFFSLQKQAGFTFVNSQKFEEFKYAENSNSRAIQIGNDVWIGSDVLLMEGITIGDGAIIAAGSVVTKNIAPYTINMGVPSREKSKRFNDDQIDILLNTKWWDQDPEWLKNNADLFVNIENLESLKIRS